MDHNYFYSQPSNKKSTTAKPGGNKKSDGPAQQKASKMEAPEDVEVCLNLLAQLTR